MKLIIEKDPGKRISRTEREKKAGRGYVYHRSHQPIFRMRLLLKNLEGEPELYVNRIHKRIYQIDKLISFLKVFEKARDGLAMIHGASLVDTEERGYMFVGQQDVGKTAMTLMLANKDGYAVLGDDTFHLSNSGLLTRNQKQIGIFPHPENLKGLSLSIGERVVAWIKRLIFIHPPFCHLIYPNLRVDYSKLPKIVDQQELHKVFILEKGAPSVSRLDKEIAIRKIMATSLDLVIPGGFPHRMFYTYTFFNNISPTLVEKQYEKIIDEALKDKDVHLIQGQGPHDFYKLFLEHEKNTRS